MILRKPYAFFIKHFKLFHIIMTLLLGYLILKVAAVNNFFNNYMQAKEIVIGKDLVDPLFSVFIYITAYLFILTSFCVLVLMIYKRKNPFYYLFQILLGIAFIVFIGVAKTTIGTMETEIVTLRTIRLVRDFLTLLMLFGTIFLILNFVRSIGFSVRKFDFEEGFDGLNINEEDNEEFELDISIDSNEYRRKLRRRLRNFKYFYRERKFIIDFSILFVVLISIFVTSFLMGNFKKYHNEKDIFTTSQHIMEIKESYLIKDDYKDNIAENSKFIILKLNIKNSYTSNRTFRVASSQIYSGKNKYYHDRDYINNFTDLGIVYDDQKLSDDAKDYLLVYKLDINDNTDDLIFKYNDINTDKDYLVKLNPIDLKENMQIKDYKLGETLKINDNFNGEIIIKNYDIKSNFKVDYKFCVTDSECFNSSEYLYPSLTGRNNKALLKINGSLEYKKGSISGVTNLSDLIIKFASIDYEIKDQKFSQTEGFNEVKPIGSKTPDYYIEVNQDIMKADKIYLNFMVRGTNYRYVLK